MNYLKKRYGRLVVVSEPSKVLRGKYYRRCVKVQCDCGNTNEVRVDLLDRGKIKSCGCLANEIKKELKERYGKLTVFSEPYRRYELVGRAMYVDVICDCGVKKYVKAINLKSGITSSCGCVVAEITIKTHTTHGLSKHPLFGIWSGILNRCYYKGSSGYENYGGNGVTMCDEWKNDFKAFYDWSIVNGWKKGLQIDKDIKGGNIYSPENCIYVTQQVNARHKRTTKLSMTIAIKIRHLYSTGKYKCNELANMYNVSGSAIYGVINNTNWI